MKNIHKYLYLILLLSFSACTYEFPEEVIQEPTSGEANFSKMISVGNSLTAGYMDGALYNRGQENSYAVILSDQMTVVGGGVFNTPSINSVNGFFGLAPDGQTPLGRLILTVNPQTGATGPAPIGLGEIPTAFSGNKSTLNNFGVSGITLLTSLIPQTGGPNVPQNPAFNPFYARFASNPGQSTVIGDAAAALKTGGTFFTFWLGNNDVLGYAVSGASNPSILTSNTDFQQRLSSALGTMLQANPEAKGAVANIPNLNVLPYFNLVPWNALPLDQGTAAFVNQAYLQYNGGLAQLAGMGLITEAEKTTRTIVFKAGQNGFVMADKNLTDLTGFGLPSIRQSNNTDKPVLTLSTALGVAVGGNPQLVRGVSFPVEDSFVLTQLEQEECQSKVTAFNALIAAAVQASSNRLVLVDVNNLLNQVLQGQINAGGALLTASIIPPNGGFSLDGVHPNARSHAFIANHFIDAINAKWGANIPRSNPNAYPGNDLPVGG